MTMEDYQKLLELFGSVSGDKSDMNVRVLLEGGIWVEGKMTADINGTVHITPDPVAQYPGIITTHIERVVAVQFT